MALPLTEADLRDAADRIAPRVHRTPIHGSRLLGERVGATMLLKCELFQRTGSYKARGALNRVMTLDAESARRGCVTISAGNFAQALAWAGTAAGISTTVVMPAGASPVKAAAARDYGATVIVQGTVTEAFALAHQIADSEGRTFIHPFDHPDIVAGTGTVGLEIAASTPADIVVVPVGGGGLIAGVAIALAHVSPSTKVYGVEPEGACAMRKSLDAGRAVHLDHVHSVADGLAPPMAGELNYQVVRDAVEDVVLVSDQAILDAMGLVWSRTKLFVEPSGAAGVAALLGGQIPDAHGTRAVAILSGGNVNLDQIGTYAAGWAGA